MIKYSLLQVVLFWTKQINRLLKLTLGYSLHSGRLIDKRSHQNSRDKCVHIRDIWWRAQLAEISAVSSKNFLLSHQSYVSLDYLRKDNVYLYFIDHDAVHFIEVEDDFDAYDSDHGPFVYAVMYQKAKKIITVNVDNFLKFANDIGDPEANVVLLSNTGRCGSTLLTQMMEGVPNTVVISEPLFIMAFNGHDKKMTEQYGSMQDEIIAAGIRVQCKPTCKGKADHIIIKTHSMAVKYAPTVARMAPNVKHVFMYRGPRKTILSYSAMMGAIPPIIVKMFMGNAMDGFLLMALPDETEKEEMVRELSKHVMKHEFLTLTMCAAFWCVHVLNYVEYQAKGLVNFHPIGYEDLLANPEQELGKLLDHCHMPNDDLTKCIEAMGKDSQKGSILSKANLKKVRKEEISDQDIEKINVVLAKFGFPDIDNYKELFKH